MSKRWMLAAAIAVSAAGLAGCGYFFDQKPKPVRPPELVKASGATVRVTDQQAGDPVEMRMDQRLVVQLYVEGANNAEWVLADFQPGVFPAPPPPYFEQNRISANDSILAGTQIWRFTPTQPGQVTLKFELRIPHSRDGVLQSANYVVTVR